MVKDLNSLDSNKIDVLKNIADVLRSIRNFSDLYHISNAEDRGKLLRTAIDIIYIDYDKAKKEIRQIHIEWNEVWRVILDPDLLRYKDILVIKQKGMLPR